MSSHPSITVVIPAYQSAETIERALKSVALQTLRPAEVIVIDDGSKDGTADIARRATDLFDDSTLTVIEQENEGPGSARNTGLRRAQTDLVAFLDADDEWLPDKLERSVAPLAEENVELVAHDIVRMEDGIESEVLCSKLFLEAEDPFVALYRKGLIATSTVVARTDALRAVGGFSEILPNAQDFDLWLRVLGPPDRTYRVIDAPLTRYHISNNSVTSHTARRLHCTLAIAEQHVPTLRDRQAAVWTNYWYRILAVHYESITVYAKQRRPVQLLWVSCALPVRLIFLSLKLLRAPKE